MEQKFYPSSNNSANEILEWANTKQETRVYLIDLNNDTREVEVGDWDNLTDDQWIDLSERQGYVLSLAGFQKAFNKEEIPYDTYLRFITITLN